MYWPRLRWTVFLLLRSSLINHSIGPPKTKAIAYRLSRDYFVIFLRYSLSQANLKRLLLLLPLNNHVVVLNRSFTHKFYSLQRLVTYVRADADRLWRVINEWTSADESLSSRKHPQRKYYNYCCIVINFLFQYECFVTWTNQRSRVTKWSLWKALSTASLPICLSALTGGWQTHLKRNYAFRKCIRLYYYETELAADNVCLCPECMQRIK